MPLPHAETRSSVTKRFPNQQTALTLRLSQHRSTMKLLGCTRPKRYLNRSLVYVKTSTDLAVRTTILPKKLETDLKVRERKLRRRSERNSRLNRLRSGSLIIKLRPLLEHHPEAPFQRFNTSEHLNFQEVKSLSSDQGASRKFFLYDRVAFHILVVGFQVSQASCRRGEDQHERDDPLKMIRGGRGGGHDHYQEA